MKEVLVGLPAAGFLQLVGAAGDWRGSWNPRGLKNGIPPRAIGVGLGIREPEAAKKRDGRALITQAHWAVADIDRDGHIYG